MIILYTHSSSSGKLSAIPTIMLRETANASINIATLALVLHPRPTMLFRLVLAGELCPTHPFEVVLAVSILAVLSSRPS